MHTGKMSNAVMGLLVCFFSVTLDTLFVHRFTQSSGVIISFPLSSPTLAQWFSKYLRSPRVLRTDNASSVCVVCCLKKAILISYISWPHRQCTSMSTQVDFLQEGYLKLKCMLIVAFLIWF